MNYGRAVYSILSLMNKLIPKKKNLIFMNGKETVRWNVFALLSYLSEQGYDRHYDIVCYVKDKNKIKERYLKLSGIRFIDRPIAGAWMKLRAKYYFSEMMGEMFTCKPERGQISMQLGHGFALKAMYYPKEKQYFLSTFSKIMCYSQYVKEIMQKEWGFADESVVISQNPRCDWLLPNDPLTCPFPLENVSKNIIWLPTFRIDPGSNRINSNVSFPIVNNESIMQLDQICKKYDVRLFIKPHPLQSSLEFFDYKYSNIYIIKPDAFDKIDIEFYEFLRLMDALITDYSSVAFDFMLLNRPIGYTIDDFDSYNSMRGFHFDDPLKFMPGHHIKTIDDFNSFLSEISSGVDSYKAERQKVCDIINEKKANNCKNVLDGVGIA